MDGYQLVDKPEGISSFGAVARVRRTVSEAVGRKVKVGHTGTLDPAATGLLILVLGSYTKRAGEFSKLDKVYEAELTLGAVSTTADREGDIVRKSVHRPSLTDINNALNKFVGEITQTPPAYSAIKVGGQRAYKLARAGKQVKMEPRKATILSLDSVDYKYPKLKFTVHVSSGTYIRSLAEDIGHKLKTGAYLSNLRRTKVGKFGIAGALTLDNLDYETLTRTLKT